jgi:hypothetical protein
MELIAKALFGKKPFSNPKTSGDTPSTPKDGQASPQKSPNPFTLLRQQATRLAARRTANGAFDDEGPEVDPFTASIEPLNIRLIREIGFIWNNFNHYHKLTPTNAFTKKNNERLLDYLEHENSEIRRLAGFLIMFYFKTAKPAESRDWITQVSGKKSILQGNLLFITAGSNFTHKTTLATIEKITKFAVGEKRPTDQASEMVFWHWPLSGNILHKSLPVTTSNFKKSIASGQKYFQHKEFPDPRRCLFFIE